MVNTPKRQARRTTQAIYYDKEFPTLAQNSTAGPQRTPNVWEERTQASQRSNDSTLLEPSLPANIQRLLDGVKASNEKSINLSGEAMATATGVASALGTVTTRMENIEKTVAQINKNRQETRKIVRIPP